jgi:hypothetical protein
MRMLKSMGVDVLVSVVLTPTFDRRFWDVVLPNSHRLDPDREGSIRKDSALVIGRR